mgnify:CR=1 FL=1
MSNPEIALLMLGMFIWFYPSFMSYMGGTFKSFMPAYAIVFVDTDNGLTHSAIYDIPADTTSLPENVENAYEPSDVPGAKQPRRRGSAVSHRDRHARRARDQQWLVAHFPRGVVRSYEARRGAGAAIAP